MNSFFQSRRSNVVAVNGAVASSQPLATQAGLQTLMEGGNAVDAAVCMAATLAVVEPMSTGLGGDLFSLVWMADSKKVHALNGSGRSAAGANIGDIQLRSYSAIPTEGDGAAMSVSVPGSLDGWHTLLDRFGEMSLREVLRPPIRYALQGFGVSELIASSWQTGETKLKYRPSGAELLMNGRAPNFGDIIRLPNLGRTLQAISSDGRDAFYQGETARAICNFVQAEGGWLALSDMEQHRSEWVEPISANYRKFTVWECPPNGQGIAALAALNIAEGFDIGSMGSQSAERYHYLAEAMRLGFADALAYVADPSVVHVPSDVLLSEEYAAERRSLIGETAITEVLPGLPASGGDTVYVTAVDSHGNACSLINSLYQGFGSGLVAPGTGVALQNRGSLFSLDPSHPNCLEGGKRPYHTIIPGMTTVDGEFSFSFGVMGGFQQPQGHLQIISNMLDFGMPPQQALDALRFSLDVTGDGTLRVEEDLGADICVELSRRGHKVEKIYGLERLLFGGGQIVARNPETGLLTAGSEPRKDGCALGW